MPARMSDGYSAIATSASMRSVESATVRSSWPTSPSRTVWPSLTGPPCARSGLVSLAAMSFARRPRRFEITRPRIEARVRTPMPPMLTPRKMTNLPNGEKNVAMSTVESPVTQIVETAVKTASASGRDCPVVVAAGSESSPVKRRMSATKTRTANRAGDDVVRFRTRSNIRRQPVRGTSGPLGSPSNAFCRERVPLPRLPSDMRVLSAATRWRNAHHGTPRGARLI